MSSLFAQHLTFPEQLMSEIDTSVTQNVCGPNVRFGSKADMGGAQADVR